MAEYGNSNKKQYYGGKKTNYGKARAVQKEKEKQAKEQAERRLMQQQIETEYQANIAKKNKRGALDRVFDVLSTPGFMVNGALQDGWKGIGEGFKAGMDGFVPGNKEYGKEYEFGDSLDMATQGEWNKWNPEFGKGKIVKSGVNFLGEVLTDPTTYIGGAGIAKSIGKGTGRRAGKEAMEEITQHAIKIAAKEKSIALAPEQIARYTKDANKLAGNAITKGDMTFAGKQLKGSGDALRALGDKTIAPTLNTLGDATRGKLPAFSTKARAKQALTKGDVVDFVGQMHIKDSTVASNINKFKYIGDSARKAEKPFGKDKKDNELMEELTAFMENKNNYESFEVLEELPKAQSDTVIDEFMSDKFGVNVENIDDTLGKLWDDVLASDDPYEKLKHPTNKLEQFVYKRMIDPDNSYRNYTEAFEGMMASINSTKSPLTVNMDSGLKTLDDAIASTPKPQDYTLSTLDEIKQLKSTIDYDVMYAPFNDEMNYKREWMSKNGLENNTMNDDDVNSFFTLLESENPKTFDYQKGFNKSYEPFGEIDKPEGSNVYRAGGKSELVLDADIETVTSRLVNESAPEFVEKQKQMIVRQAIEDYNKTLPEELRHFLTDGDMFEAYKRIHEGDPKYYKNIQMVERAKSVVDDLRQGKVNDPETKRKLLELDASLPPDLQTYDTYTETLVDPTSGEAYQTIYDPFTGETNKLAVEKTIVKDIALAEPKRSTLDAFMDNESTIKNFNQSLSDYVHNYVRHRNPGEHYVMRDGKAYIQRYDRRLSEQALSAKPELADMAKYLYQAFREMGMQEEYIGKLNSKIEAYMPHMINKEMLKNPNIVKQLEKQEPELFRTIFRSAGEKWNPHGTERSAILEEKVKAILTDKRKSMDMDYSDIDGKSIAQVNEALKPILEKAGFDGNFFLNNAYEIYMQRMVTHGEVLYANRTINQTLENFGKFVPRSSINPKGKYVVNQQELKEVFKDMDDTRQFLLLEEMKIPLDKVYNKMLIEVDGKQLDQLHGAVEKYGKEGNRPVQGYSIPEQILQEMNNKGYVQQFEDTHAFLKVYDKFSNLWKQTATVINPGFHMRNKFSNIFQNYLAVGNEVFNVQTRSIAKQILSNTEGELITKNGTRIPFDEIRTQLASRDIVNMQAFSPIEGFMGQAHGVFEEELRGSGGVFEAIGRMVGVQNPTALNKLDPTDTANFLPFTAGRAFGGKVEDFDRTLNFIANIKNDVDYDTAGDMVNKFLFDYADLTSFESNVMKRIIPFYTWIRKNAPLQLEMLMEKPGLYAGIADITRMTKSDDPNLPSYMSDYMQLPINWKGRDLMVDLNMPYQDLGKDYSDPATTVGMLNPFLKAILEVGTNKNYFFDSEIIDEDDTFKQAMDKYGKYMKQSMLGAYNTWEKVLEGDASKAFGMATGVTPQWNDAEKNKSDAIYRAIREIEERMEKDKQTGAQYRFNQEFDEYKQTKLEKYGY